MVILVEIYDLLDALQPTQPHGSMVADEAEIAH